LGVFSNPRNIGLATICHPVNPARSPPARPLRAFFTGNPNVPVVLGTEYRNRPDENANVTIGAKQGDSYISWGCAWILLGKTLEVYGDKEWWLK
jgi:hypothetical protein